MKQVTPYGTPVRGMRKRPPSRLILPDVPSLLLPEPPAIHIPVSGVASSLSGPGNANFNIINVDNSIIQQGLNWFIPNDNFPSSAKRPTGFALAIDQDCACDLTFGTTNPNATIRNHQQLLQYASPCDLSGDFNNPYGNDGNYLAMYGRFRYYSDAYPDLNLHVIGENWLDLQARSMMPRSSPFIDPGGPPPYYECSVLRPGYPLWKGTTIETRVHLDPARPQSSWPTFWNFISWNPAGTYYRYYAAQNHTLEMDVNDGLVNDGWTLGEYIITGFPFDTETTTVTNNYIRPDNQNVYITTQSDPVGNPPQITTHYRHFDSEASDPTQNWLTMLINWRMDDTIWIAFNGVLQQVVTIPELNTFAFGTSDPGNPPYFDQAAFIPAQMYLGHQFAPTFAPQNDALTGTGGVRAHYYIQYYRGWNSDIVASYP